MIITDLIEELKEKEIEITFSEGKLKYTGPEENISPELIENLKKNKGKLIKYFWPQKLNRLMPINPVGSRKPLFVIHGDNSNYIISKYFGKDQPVYGFFHPGSEGEGIPYKSVVDMASSYLEAVLTVSPSGPYYLIGYSFGGVIAYEMAVQLQQAGHNVPFLVLIDSLSPYVREFVEHTDNLLKTIRYNYLRPVRRRLKRRIRYFICSLYVLLKKPIPVKRRSYYMWERYLTMTRKYKPQKFNGDILLFRTTGQQSTDRYLGWKSLVNNIKLVEIEGKHLEIFEGDDKVQIFQKELELYLAEANELH